MQTPGPANLRALVRSAGARLGEAGVPSPEHDARALARHVLDLTGGGTYELTEAVGADFSALYESLISRRAAREPLQIIIGEAHFHAITLETQAGVFIPRPETEALVEAALAAVPRALRVVDLCTGSGTLAIALAKQLPHAQVWAVELDEAAASLAQRNAQRNGVRVTVVHGDAADALPELDGTVDLVVANPPYIPPDGVPRDAEVRLWDPPAALYGGGMDGLETPRTATRTAKRLLRAGGNYLMEHGDAQGAAVRSLVGSVQGFSMIETRQDLAGRDRFVMALRDSARAEESNA